MHAPEWLMPPESGRREADEVRCEGARDDPPLHDLNMCPFIVPGRGLSRGVKLLRVPSGQGALRRQIPVGRALFECRRRCEPSSLLLVR